MYGHGGHLGHVTSPFEQMASEKMFKNVDEWTGGGQTEVGVIGILLAQP